MAKPVDLDTILKSFTRENLNKLVQKTIFSYDFKEFSKDLKAFLSGDSDYATVLVHIQEGLFGRAGNDLKYYRNIPEGESVPNYMSATELIMYRTAIRDLDYHLWDLEHNKNKYAAVYDAANEAGEKVWNDFYKYRKIKNQKLRSILNYSGEGRIDSVIIKNFNKALKLGFYNRSLSSSILRQDVINRNSEDPYAKTFSFKPYSDSNFDKYENFRRNFVKIINSLDSDFKLRDCDIERLFQSYESNFYKTDFLKVNHINVIDYLLGFSKGIYFSERDLTFCQKELNHFLEGINALNNCSETDFPSKDSKISFLEKHLIEKANEERKSYIEKNVENLIMPESSDPFLVACLDFIANQKRSEARANNKPFPIDFNEFSTQDIRKLPKSFTDKSFLVEKSIFKKRMEKDNDQPPTFWDMKYIPEPPVVEPPKKVRKSRNEEPTL